MGIQIVLNESVKYDKNIFRQNKLERHTFAKAILNVHWKNVQFNFYLIDRYYCYDIIKYLPMNLHLRHIFRKKNQLR